LQLREMIPVRALGVDHGQKRIGVAISDGTGTVARPLTIVQHRSRSEDVRRLLELAAEHNAALIVVGQSNDELGNPNPAGRRAIRFAALLAANAGIKVLLWDESLSTVDARAARISAAVSRKRRAAPVDAEAAAVILQSYLDAAGSHAGVHNRP
jgi:putative Holliday junction resolvase